MNIIEDLLNNNSVENIGDYFSLFRQVEQLKNEDKINGLPKLKIAFLSSFTAKGVKEVLTIKCLKNKIFPEIYIGGYNQYSQEIVKKDSALYSFSPELIIVFIDLQALLGDSYFSSFEISDEKKKEIVEKKFEEISSLIDTLSKNTAAKILFHNFEVPHYSSLGILENKQKFGFLESIRELNRKLEDKFKSDKKVFVFDYDLFCSKIGKTHLSDRRMYYLADIKIDMNFLPDLANEYLAYIKPLLSLNKKCIVLDLDNTLWGGIIGEDGFENIKLGPTTEGRPFVEFQKHILNLFNRGIILAVNSSNNAEDVIRVLKEHPYMVLRENRFAALRINWNDKVSNMKEIAKELNIGLDSMVFIDDSQVNREFVKKSLPEVLVVDLPDDSALYVETLEKINDFNTMEITDEDKKKGEMYGEQRQRESFKKDTVNISDYLRGLETVVTFKKIDNFTIPRIAQLTQKTNQFNMTTRRYFEDDINKFLKNGCLISALNVKDKFGDNGITGLAIAEKTPESWKINTFLLSCRVIGREIENVLLGHIIEQAQKENVKKLIGEFIKTSKNDPAKDFYNNNNFKFVKKENDKEIWEYDLKEKYKFPDFIKVEYEF